MFVLVLLRNVREKYLFKDDEYSNKSVLKYICLIWDFLRRHEKEVRNRILMRKMYQITYLMK